jgi:hypothetical protein
VENGDFLVGLMKEVTEWGRWTQLCHETPLGFHGLPSFRIDLPHKWRAQFLLACGVPLEKLLIRQFLPSLPRKRFKEHAATTHTRCAAIQSIMRISFSAGLFKVRVTYFLLSWYKITDTFLDGRNY